MTRHARTNQLSTIPFDQLDTVTGGWVLPLIGGIASAAVTVGTAVWAAGHEKGVSDRSCSAKKK